MPYMYAADLWCDSCGEAINRLASSQSDNPDVERAEYVGEDTGESDSPCHCGSHEDCLEAETLPSGRKIGALLSTSLTSYGIEYVKEAVADGGEVSEFWRQAFDWIDFPIPPCPEEFFNAYVECALWSTCEYDDEGNYREPLEDNYGTEDIAEETLKEMRADCDAFWQDNLECHSNPEQAGHDFWLTRNRHGAGFWDRSPETYPDDPDGKKLTDSSHAYGSVDLYVGDDGQIYC